MQLKGHVWALGYEYVSSPSPAIQILAPGWLVLPTLANPLVFLNPASSRFYREVSGPVSPSLPHMR